MQLWTCHPSDFHVDDPNLVVDYKKGMYWKENTLGYRKALLRLHDRLGKLYPDLHELKTQFLWCYTKRGQCWRASEEVEQDSRVWELNVPRTQILSGYRVSVWDGPKFEKGILEGKDNWHDLLVPVDEIEWSDPDLSVLVRVPLPNREWAKCLGPVPVRPVGAGS